MKIIFSSEFSQDLDSQYKFYHDRGNYEGNPTLGIVFVEEVHNAIDYVEAHPTAWHPITSDFLLRRIHLKKFKDHFIRYTYDSDKDILYIDRLTHSAQK